MPHMYVMKFDDQMRAARAKGIEYKRIDTVYENTPEFEALWAAYCEITKDDPYYHICTEPDGRTHTFYRIILPPAPTNDTEPTPAPTNEEDHNG